MEMFCDSCWCNIPACYYCGKLNVNPMYIRPISASIEGTWVCMVSSIRFVSYRLDNCKSIKTVAAIDPLSQYVRKGYCALFAVWMNPIALSLKGQVLIISFWIFVNNARYYSLLLIKSGKYVLKLSELHTYNHGSTSVLHFNSIIAHGTNDLMSFVINKVYVQPSLTCCHGSI